MTAVSFRQFARKRAVSSASNLTLDGFRLSLDGTPETQTPSGYFRLLAEQPGDDEGNPLPVPAKGPRVTLNGSDDKDADAGRDNYQLLPDAVQEFLSTRYPGCDGAGTGKGKGKDNRGGLDPALTPAVNGAVNP